MTLVSYFQNFRVSSTATLEDPPQGVWIESPDRAAVIVILFIPNGSTQAFTLKLSGTDALAPSQSLPWGELLRQAIGTMRVPMDLSAARALASETLSRTHLESTPPGTPEWDRAILQAQHALISQISVSPREPNAFFHLAGTSFLIARKGLEKRPP